ncbi:peptidoglycan-binding domain-containing protein [Rhodopseudomonas sp. B29]|uniref:peptidoglycan-binding domain-containing protein n=1 Tax=Rhodopseudomonas sp. B29 TaxID=95607 RepID=UPI00034D6246|nr:peptidoglycan-binding domain-containing protein [Rhodopseudomonas sp. B29]
MPRKSKDVEAPRRGRKAAAAAADESEERGLVMRLLMHSPKDVVAGMFASAAVVAIITNAMFMQAGRHPSPMFGSAPSTTVSVITLPRPRPVEAEPRLDNKALEAKLLEPAITPFKPDNKSADAKPADAKPADVMAAETKPLEAKTIEAKLAETRPGVVKTVDTKPAEARHAAPVRDSHVARGRPMELVPDDPMANLVRSTAGSSAGIPRPPAAIPVASADNVSAIGGSRRVAAVQRALTDFGYGQLKPTGVAGADTQAVIARFERARHLPVTGHISDRLVRELSVVTGRAID